MNFFPNASEGVQMFVAIWFVFIVPIIIFWQLSIIMHEVHLNFLATCKGVDRLNDLTGHDPRND
jgi:hypothetical protein